MARIDLEESLYSAEFLVMCSGLLEDPLAQTDFPSGSDGKASAQCGRPGFDSWVRKIPWRRKWQSTPALWPGKSHGRRSLIGYSSWGGKELDPTERLHFH